MRRIALVGTADTGDQAPYDDSSFEIWGVSARAHYVTRATRWFELHRLSGEPQDWADNWRKTVKTFSHDVELMMLYPEPDLGPRVTTYPAERIAARFGTYFMSSTFSWMIALAIDEMCPKGEEWNPGEIALFGVDMEHGTEYREQRAGAHHFINLARVMGITVTLIVSGGLAYEPVPYPMWQDDPLTNKLNLRTKRSRERLANLDVGIKNTRMMIAQNNALLMEFDLAQQKGYSIEKRREEIEDELQDLIKTSSGTSKEIVQIEGAHEEQQWMRDYLSR